MHAPESKSDSPPWAAVIIAASITGRPHELECSAITRSFIYAQRVHYSAPQSVLALTHPIAGFPLVGQSATPNRQLVTWKKTRRTSVQDRPHQAAARRTSRACYPCDRWEAEHPGNRNELRAELFGDDGDEDKEGEVEPGYAQGPASNGPPWEVEEDVEEDDELQINLYHQLEPISTIKIFDSAAIYHFIFASRFLFSLHLSLDWDLWLVSGLDHSRIERDELRGRKRKKKKDGTRLRTFISSSFLASRFINIFGSQIYLGIGHYFIIWSSAPE